MRLFLLLLIIFIYATSKLFGFNYVLDSIIGYSPFLFWTMLILIVIYLLLSLKKSAYPQHIYKQNKKAETLSEEFYNFVERVEREKNYYINQERNEKNKPDSNDDEEDYYKVIEDGFKF